jgi:methionyl-tRNA synthetase
MNSLNGIPVWALFLLYVWSILWKGLALWRCAKLEQRNWFVAILVLNTVGVLEIVYLFFFAKKRFNPKELMFWNKK